MLTRSVRLECDYTGYCYMRHEENHAPKGWFEVLAVATKEGASIHVRKLGGGELLNENALYSCSNLDHLASVVGKAALTLFPGPVASPPAVHDELTVESHPDHGSIEKRWPPMPRPTPPAPVPPDEQHWEDPNR